MLLVVSVVGVVVGVVQIKEVAIQIKEVANIKELLQTHRAHERDLNHVHLSACWVSLS